MRTTMKSVLKKGMFLVLSLIIWASFVPVVSADICLTDSPFGDEIVFGFGVQGGTTSPLLDLSGRRYTFDERAVYGTLSRRPSVWVMSLEWQFGNGTISLFCELNPSTLSGPGTLIQSFIDATPVANPITCELIQCTPPTAVTIEGMGTDPEQQ